MTQALLLIVLLAVAVGVEPSILEVEPGGSGLLRLTVAGGELKPIAVRVEAYADGLTVEPDEANLSLRPFASTSLNFTVKAPPDAYPGLRVVRFSVEAGDARLTATAAVKVTRPQVTVTAPAETHVLVAILAAPAAASIALMAKRRRRTGKTA